MSIKKYLSNLSMSFICIWNRDESCHHVPATTLRNVVIRARKMVYCHHRIVEFVIPD